jgi:ribosomal protein S1
LAWQRIDDPSDLFKVGDSIKAEIISIEGSKIFLSAKKLLTDPWHDVDTKYKVGQAVAGMILKVNPFGLFVELDKDIHGLAHISQLELKPGQKINEIFKSGDKKEFTIVSIEPKDHRLGLAFSASESKAEPASEAKADKEEAKDESAGAKKPKAKKVKKEKTGGKDEKKTEKKKVNKK